MTYSVKAPRPTARWRTKQESARPYTDYLFVRPNFLSGAASVVDLFGRLPTYNYSRTEEEADQRGLYTDYYMVGQDFWDAMRAFESMQSYSELPQQYRLFDSDEVKHVS